MTSIHTAADTTTAEPHAPIIAERFKTKLCRNWAEKGTCPYQSRCMFAHGERERRTTAENYHDGITTEAAIAEFKRKQSAEAAARKSGGRRGGKKRSSVSREAAQTLARRTKTSFLSCHVPPTTAGMDCDGTDDFPAAQVSIVMHPSLSVASLDWPSFASVASDREHHELGTQSGWSHAAAADGESSFRSASSFYRHDPYGWAPISSPEDEDGEETLDPAALPMTYSQSSWWW